MLSHPAARGLYLVLLAVALPIQAGAQPRDCAAGPGAVRGRLVDTDGRGVRGTIAVYGIQCGTRSDSIGDFNLEGLPADSVLLIPREPSHCISPRWVSSDGRGAESFLAIPSSRMSEAQFIVWGSPWVPPSYEELSCLAASRQAQQGFLSPSAWAIPSPDEVFAWLLAQADVNRLMEEASSIREPVPVWFVYGSLREAQPPASVRYRFGWGLEPVVRGESIYMFVLRADTELVEAQVGRPDPIELEPGVSGVGEDGLRIEWRRTLAGWDAGTVTSRWNRDDRPGR